MRYTIGEVVKKYNLPRSSVYRKLKADDLQKYITIGRDGKSEISEEGLELLLKEFSETPETSQDKTRTHRDNTETNWDNSETIELYEKLLESKDQQIVSLKEETANLREQVENLNETVKKLIDLNRNNQVLLLEKKEATPKTTLLDRILGKKRD